MIVNSELASLVRGQFFYGIRKCNLFVCKRTIEKSNERMAYCDEVQAISVVVCIVNDAEFVSDVGDYTYNDVGYKFRQV